MRFQRNKKLFICIIVLTILLSTALIYRYLFRVPVIRLAISEWPGFAPAVYAQVLGLYDKYDIPIEVIYSSGPAQSNEWLMSEKVDGISAVLTDLILLKSVGSSAQALLFTDYSLEADAIVARPEIQTVEQLKGKTIGIDSLNTFSHVFVLKTLERHGLTEKDVFFKIVPFDTVVDALKNNEVQAAHTWNPEIRKALSAGFKKIANAGEIPGIILGTMSFREDLLEDYPEVFKRFARAFYEAQTRMLENPYQASEQMKYFFRNDPDSFSATFKEIHFINREENHRRLNPKAVDSFLLEALELNEFYLKRGQTNESDLHEGVISKDLAQ